MSRSVKKNPIIKDKTGRNSCAEAKAKANRRLRRKLKDDLNFCVNNNDYKKYTESWNISDYTMRRSKEDAIRDYEDFCTPGYYAGIARTEEECERCVQEFKKDYPTLDDYLNKEWKKYYVRK